MDLQQIRGYVCHFSPTNEQIRGYILKIRPEVVCTVLGFILGMCMSMGPGATLDAGVFVFSQAAAATAWTANWIVEPKYTGQEDLPPGFRGEAPSLEARVKDESQPLQCQTVDPSALVCSTVRVAGFSMFLTEGESQPIFQRRAFDEIQGRAPFVSENGKFLAFWCEKAAAWRLTLHKHEAEARSGSCKAYAAAADGVQFKDASNWLEADIAASAAPGEKVADIRREVFHDHQALDQGGGIEAGLSTPTYLFEIQVGDDWVPARDLTCR